MPDIPASTADILASIDGALRDYETRDAMRWTPEPGDACETSPPPGITADFSRFTAVLEQMVETFGPGTCGRPRLTTPGELMTEDPAFVTCTARDAEGITP